MKAAFRRLASAVWSLSTALVRLLADAGFLRRTRLPGVRVISVGNIQAGGAGKTPLVAQIAREAAERGLFAAILCRGYGGEWEFSGGTLLPGESTPNASVCGDEAALLHELAPQAVIGVGADRERRFAEICRLPGSRKPDLVILDDGFQHWKIARDRDLVAVTSAQSGELLFRDWRSALRRADLLIWTKGELRPQDEGRPLARVRFRLLSAAAGASRPVRLVTGVADFREVRRALEMAGYRVAEHTVFPDHARYNAAQVRELAREAREAGWDLAITGKDWVKWRSAGISRDEVIVLEPELVFEEGRELWERILWG